MSGRKAASEAYQGPSLVVRSRCPENLLVNLPAAGAVRSADGRQKLCRWKVIRQGAFQTVPLPMTVFQTVPLPMAVLQTIPFPMIVFQTMPLPMRTVKNDNSGQGSCAPRVSRSGHIVCEPRSNQYLNVYFSTSVCMAA